MSRGIALVVELPLLFVGLLLAAGVCAQQREGPGKPIGKVSILGNLILLELDEDAPGREHLFVSADASAAGSESRWQ